MMGKNKSNAQKLRMRSQLMLKDIHRHHALAAARVRFERVYVL